MSITSSSRKIYSFPSNIIKTQITPQHIADILQEQNANDYVGGTVFPHFAPQKVQLRQEEQANQDAWNKLKIEAEQRSVPQTQRLADNTQPITGKSTLSTNSHSPSPQKSIKKRKKSISQEITQKQALIKKLSKENEEKHQQLQTWLQKDGLISIFTKTIKMVFSHYVWPSSNREVEAMCKLKSSQIENFLLTKKLLLNFSCA